MKYRMLTSEELEVFDEDFKHFLIVHGIHNEEWVEMNANAKEKAVELVELFSDTVLQKVYEKIKFIEHRSKNSCLVFKLAEAHMELISILSKSENTLDLSTPESIHKAMVENPESLLLHKTKKEYSREREVEIHEMMNQGCVISSESFWILLEKVLE